MVTLLTGSHSGYAGFPLQYPLRTTMNSTGGQALLRKMKGTVLNRPQSSGTSLCPWLKKKRSMKRGMKTASEIGSDILGPFRLTET